jgi:mercuric ion transport protein
MHIGIMSIDVHSQSRASGTVQTLMAAGGFIGAIAASSCCILPLVLFSLGISGAWIGKLTQLAPYQPYFLAASGSFLALGYLLVYRSSKVACENGQVCRRPLPDRMVKLGLVVATILVLAALALDLSTLIIFES